jgi:uracil-DNA glycosylase
VDIRLPADWQDILAPEMEKPYFKALEKFVDQERKAHKIFPPEDEVFSAFQLTPYGKVKVLILGQDPYPTAGHGHGLAFSVKPGVRPLPGSLLNIFKELKDDVGCKMPNNGFLKPWAEQGVMMVNAVLTVREGQANSHKDQGWETFTDAVIKAISNKNEHVVFLLWGKYAQKKGKLIDKKRHTVIEGAHPSPLSVKLFMGSKPFSSVNDALESHGQTPINWQIPDL